MHTPPWNHEVKPEKDPFNATIITNGKSQKAAAAAWQQSLCPSGAKHTQTRRSANIYYLSITSASALSLGCWKL